MQFSSRVTGMPVCDSCGREVDDEHIRARISRLEWTTRYRPVHMQFLLIDSTPPAKIEDFFYNPAKDRSVRSVASRAYFDELMKCAGVPSSSINNIDEDTAITEFQRRGCFLVYACECPLAPSEASAFCEKSAPVLLQRVRASYKPKRIVFLSKPAASAIPAFQQSEWNNSLVLDNGGPFIDPFLADPPAQAEFATGFGDRLAKIISPSAQ